MSNIYDKASLVLIPSGTKTSKVYSQKPVNGDGDFTFSRSTAATRVNADGNIEKETQNLLLQSNDFDTTWTNASTTETSGQADRNGGTDAWLLAKAGAGGYIQQSVSASGVFTQSIYAKAGTLNWMRISNSGISNAIAYYDLSNGAVGTTLSAVVDASIEDIGSGWYRCVIVLNGTSGAMRIFPANGDNDISGTSGNIYIQDAQLEQGLVARDYIETTTAAVEGGITDNVPRLDYTDSSCPALLLEPQRTNLFTQSEYFGTNYWGKITTTITTNTGISPDGYENATTLTPTSASTNSGITSYLVTSTTAHTMSVYAKVASGTKSFKFFRYNSTDGSVSSPIFTATTTWQRFTWTTSPSVAGSSWYIVNGAADTIPFDIYGAQLEAGSYATSYIPTYGTSVTRNNDSISLYNQDDLFGEGKGTWFIDINLQSRLFYNYSILGSYPNYIGVNVSTTYMDMEIIDNAVLSGQIRYNNSSTGRFKIAIAYDGNSAFFYVNGAKIGEDTSVSIPSVNDIFLRNNEANANAFRYNQALLFPTKLTEEELAALTTL